MKPNGGNVKSNAHSNVSLIKKITQIKDTPKDESICKELFL